VCVGWAGWLVSQSVARERQEQEWLGVRQVCSGLFLSRVMAVRQVCLVLS
jgi:hypothetical protein